jgi:hypothetical protein
VFALIAGTGSDLFDTDLRGCREAGGVSIGESLVFNLPTRHALWPRSLAKPPTTDLYTPNRLFGSIATVMPRSWSLAACGVLWEVGRWQMRPCFFNRRNDAPLRLYFLSARK